MAVKQVTVQEAASLQKQGVKYVDVRSVPEFAAGHPAGAVNVPLLHHDPRTGQMVPNHEFVDVMKANFPPDTPILVGCQAGRRSAQAAQLLAAAGFSNVTDVLGGFGGARDPLTGRVQEGWVSAGLPLEPESAAGESYASLRAAASGER